MNHGVAADAWCGGCGACVDPVNRAGRDRAMALIAQGVDRRHVEQPRILRAMWRMATHTPFRLDHCVLVHKGSTGFRVAFRADGILVGSRLHLIVAKRAVCIMAIAALDEAFIHLVMEGCCERRLHVGMALIAEVRLTRLEQNGVRRSVMHRVATDAAYVCLGVRRAEEIGMGPCVAAQASFIHLLWARRSQVENLCLVPT